MAAMQANEDPSYYYVDLVHALRSRSSSYVRTWISELLSSYPNTELSPPCHCRPPPATKLKPQEAQQSPQNKIIATNVSAF
jgi:hypothetical protein